MAVPPAGSPARPRRVVATGFTSGYLGDERSLREFVVGEHVRQGMEAEGYDAALLLVNDTYDPLDIRQLRIAVEKNDALIRRFEPFCGRPIAEIPDPWDCHSDYGAHFSEALISRLASLGIQAGVRDSYRAYREGRYRAHLEIVLEQHGRIVESIARAFDGFRPKHLVRLQCERCRRIDSTTLTRVEAASVSYDCERCGYRGAWPREEMAAKLSWKLDCAARWNLYEVDTEVFSRTHLTDLGTLPLSQFVSREFFQGRIPAVVRYGVVKISRELSGKLSGMVPPAVLRAMFLGRLRRDLEIDRDFVENFCRKSEIRPGVSWVDYVRKELPLEATLAAGEEEGGPAERERRERIRRGNRFSAFFYGREFGLPAPSAERLAGKEEAALREAAAVLAFALEARRAGEGGGAGEGPLRERLRERRPSPAALRALRALFGQREGPHVRTLLVRLPLEYLRRAEAVLAAELRRLDAARSAEAVEPALASLGGDA